MWLEVWCQGGPADGWRYETMVEPPDRILMLADPFHTGKFIRVVGDWPTATPYERVRAVEQFDHELIYYPVERSAAAPRPARSGRRRGRSA
jgi:hypothetical protein